MLNGKFYTGLPPKMEERQGGSRHNRQQSHFFWPNDTQVDSAVETRVKRRSSLQLESAERPPLSKQLSALHEPEVDTRHRFHKEFANSSIQFYDNLQPPAQQQPASNRTVPMLRRGMQREVTPKLTTVQPSALPDAQQSAEQELLTAVNRKQAYSSKIQFYDYVNEADEQNNARRPKTDMNDKREMELNSKNSPKLQVKRNVRHLSVERELPVITKKPLNDAARPDVLRPKKILKPQAEQTAVLDFDHDVEVGMRQLRLRGTPPASKKHVTYNEHADEYAYYDERRERQPDDGYGNDYARARPQLIEGWRQTPNMRTGSGQQRQQLQLQLQQQQQQQQQQRPYVETSRSSSSHSTKSLNNNNNKNTQSYYASNKATVYNNNNNNNYNNAHEKILPKLTVTAAARRRSNDTYTTNADQHQHQQQQQQQLSDSEQLLAGDPRKHLRSSLCFNGDALMVDSTAVPTSGGGASSAAQRRSARSTAMQRVSVGLPD